MTHLGDYVLNDKKFSQLIEFEEEKTIIKKLKQSRKVPFTQRFKDPIISEVYVQCEDSSN